MPSLDLAVTATLPKDADAATLAGRVWRPDLGGPAVVTLRDGQVIDVTRSFPTSRDLCENADPAAALRAAETGADLLMKATKVDGVYDKDPQKFPEAKRFERLTYLEALNMQLRVMDSTALTLCMDNHIPIVVLNLWDEDSLERVVSGAPVGTFIGE